MNLRKLTKKQLIYRALIVLVAVFLLINIVWYIAITTKYNKYAEGFEKLVAWNSYILIENEDNFGVKYPDHLSFVGNLSFSMKNEDGSDTALLVWPEMFTDNYEYGVLLNDVEEGLVEITLTKDRQAQDEYYAEIVERNQEKITQLFSRAEEQWPSIK